MLRLEHHEESVQLSTLHTNVTDHPSFVFKQVQQPTWRAWMETKCIHAQPTLLIVDCIAQPLYKMRQKTTEISVSIRNAVIVCRISRKKNYE